VREVIRFTAVPHQCISDTDMTRPYLGHREAKHCFSLKLRGWWSDGLRIGRSHLLCFFLHYFVKQDTEMGLFSLFYFFFFVMNKGKIVRQKESRRLWESNPRPRG